MNQREELIVAAALVLTAVASFLVIWTYYGPGSRQAISICGAGTEVSINSTKFCALDVTNQLEFAGNGYSRLPNPVNYMGIQFSTVCQDNVVCGNAGCPPSTNGVCTVTTVSVLRFNMVFPDDANESLSTIIGDDIPPPVLSSHQNPVAGFEVIGPHSSLKFLLLVQEP